MTISDTLERALDLAAPAEIAASLADTLDLMVDRPLAGMAIFGEDPPVIGRYTIERHLGAGATAVVYAARDTLLHRPVALKIVIGRDADGTWRERVIREARALACLSHPNVVAVHDVGEWRSHPFIAMELVAGMTLARWQAQEPRAWPAILRHYLAAGRGLEAAHSAGLVHRDFKPANVLVSNSGRVVVTDFGLATLAEPAAKPAAGHAAEVAGPGVGTPAYLAPEQREGAPPQPSADVYSFSVALCEALMGRHPALALAGDWRRVPRRVHSTLERGMAADVTQRWARLGPVLTAMEAALPAPTALRRRAAGIVLVLVTGLAGDQADKHPRNESGTDSAPALAVAPAPHPSLPASETLDLTPAAPPSAASESEPPSPGPAVRVPITYPPPLPDVMNAANRATAAFAEVDAAATVTKRLAKEIATTTANPQRDDVTTRRTVQKLARELNEAVTKLEEEAANVQAAAKAASAALDTRRSQESTKLVTGAEALAQRALRAATAARSRVAEANRQALGHLDFWRDPLSFSAAVHAAINAGDFANAKLRLDQAADRKLPGGSGPPQVTKVILADLYAQLFDKMAAHTEDLPAKLKLLQQAEEAYKRAAEHASGAWLQRVTDRAAKIADEIRRLEQP